MTDFIPPSVEVQDQVEADLMNAPEEELLRLWDYGIDRLAFVVENTSAEDELGSRLDRLRAFFSTPGFDDLDTSHKAVLLTVVLDGDDEGLEASDEELARRIFLWACRWKIMEGFES